MNSSLAMVGVGLVLGFILGVLVCDLSSAQSWDWNSPQNQQRRFNDLEGANNLRQQQEHFNQMRQWEREQDSYMQNRRSPC